MIAKAEKKRLKKLLSDAIPLLCKNGISFTSKFSVEAMIGITVDENETVLVCFKETITSDGQLIPQMYGTDDDHDDSETTETGYDDQTADKKCRTDDDAEFSPSHDVGQASDGYINEEYLQYDHDKGRRDVKEENEAQSAKYWDATQPPSPPTKKRCRKRPNTSRHVLVKEDYDDDDDDCMLVKTEQDTGSETYNLPVGSVMVPTDYEIDDAALQVAASGSRYWPVQHRKPVTQQDHLLPQSWKEEADDASDFMKKHSYADSASKTTTPKLAKVARNVTTLSLSENRLPVRNSVIA